jgi:hypothetical protein
MLTGLDHLRLAVPDPAAAARAFAALGFTTTPERRDAAGRRSRSIMLALEHIELVEGRGEDADPRLEALAIGTKDAAESATTWRRSGLFTAPRDADERRLEPTAAGAPIATLEVAPAPTEVAGLPLVAAAQLTPEALRRPAWLSHANGAEQLVGLTVMVEDPAACAASLERLVGTAALTWTDRILAVRLGRVTAMLVAPDDVELLHAGALLDRAAPAVVALGFRVERLARTRTFLEREGVAHVARPDGSLGLVADPRHGCLVDFLEGSP